MTKAFFCFDVDENIVEKLFVAVLGLDGVRQMREQERRARTWQSPTCARWSSDIASPANSFDIDELVR